MWKERVFGIQSYFVYCVSFSAFLGFIPFLISGYLACPVLPVSSLTLYEFACSVWYNCLLLWEEMTFDLLYTYADCTPFTDSSHLWNVHLWDISEWNHIFPLTFFNLVYLIHCHFVSVCVCVCVCVYVCPLQVIQIRMERPSKLPKVNSRVAIQTCVFTFRSIIYVVYG